MITDFDVLYNRHHLSRHQIKSHFGLTDERHVFPPGGAFQTVDAFFQIVDALQMEGIEFVPIKGPVLSHQLYQDCTYRRFYDLDFLVDYDDMERVSGSLVGLGYRPAREWPTARTEKEGLRLDYYRALFRHGKDDTDVEMHWRLFGEHRFPDIGFRRLYSEHTVPHAVGGHSVRKLSNELELLFLLVHGAKHAWSRLKWLVDVNDYILNVAVDFEVMRDLAARSGFLNMIGYYNAIAEAYLPRPCMIPGGRIAIPGYLRRYTDRGIQRESQSDGLGAGKRRSIRDMMVACMAKTYLAPDLFSRYRAVRGLLGEVLSRNVVRLLRPIDRLLSDVMMNRVSRR